jgi:hypothetical protein
MSDEVHAAHCCTRHGCKYGNATCPVTAGVVEQLSDCEHGTLSDPCIGPIQVPDMVRRAAVAAFWEGVGPGELTAGQADYGLQRAVEAVIDAWELYQEQVRED